MGPETPAWPLVLVLGLGMCQLWRTGPEWCPEPSGHAPIPTWGAQCPCTPSPRTVPRTTQRSSHPAGCGQLAKLTFRPLFCLNLLGQAAHSNRKGCQPYTPGSPATVSDVTPNPNKACTISEFQFSRCQVSQGASFGTRLFPTQAVASGKVAIFRRVSVKPGGALWAGPE